MKALLASPTYGGVDPVCRRALHVAMMQAARQGTEWFGDVSADRMSFTDARNFAVEFIDCDPTLADEVDGIMWVDSDIKPEADSIARLLRTASERKLDFVTGIYHTRRAAVKPLIYEYNDKTDEFTHIEIYQRDQIIPVAACGFGFVWTSTNLILKIRELPDFSKDRGGWFPDHHYGKVSEDLGFCRHARKAGIQLYADTGVQVEHQGEVRFVGYKDYLRYLAPEGALRVQEARAVS